VREEERAESGLEQIGEDVPIARQALELVPGEDSPSRLEEPLAEPELARDDCAALPRDDVRPDLGEPSLGEVRVPFVQRAGNRELQHAVAEKLEPLV
jgi:hypothetical protein